MMNKMKAALTAALITIGCTSLCYASQPDTSFENIENEVIIDEVNNRITYDENYFIVTNGKRLTVELTEEEARTGKRSLAVTQTLEQLAFFEFEVEADTLYEFSAFLKSSAARSRIQVYGEQGGASSDLGYITVADAHSMYPDCIYKMDDHRQFVYSIISQKDWTEVKRYIYVPAANIKTGKVRIGIHIEGGTKTYMDDVTLTKADQKLLRTEITAGHEKINSINAGSYNYNAELLFKEESTSYYHDTPDVVYSLTPEGMGAVIDSETGVLTVEENTTADITVTAQLTFDKFVSTVTKNVSIAPASLPVINSIESTEIKDFSPNVQNYYDIETATPENILTVTDGGIYTIENLNGILTGLRITATEGEESNIYNFYTTDPQRKYENMVEDGSFELGLGTGKFKINNAVGTVDVTNDTACSGDSCAEISIRAYGNVRQTVRMKPDRYYIASFAVKLKEYHKKVDDEWVVSDKSTPANLKMSVSNASVIAPSSLSSQKVGKDEWVRFTSIIAVPEETDVQVGLDAQSYSFAAYIDDFYIAELSGSEDFEQIKSTENFGLLNYQTSTKGQETVSVVLKGKTSEQSYNLIVAEYTSDGKLISIKNEEIAKDGSYLINTPTGDNKQKIFLWEMKSLKPVTGYLEK